jgi:hypothetical protein
MGPLGRKRGMFLSTRRTYHEMAAIKRERLAVLGPANNIDRTV